MLTFVSSLAKSKLFKDIQSYFRQTQRLSNNVNFTYIFYCGGECYRVRDCEVFACCFPEAFLVFQSVSFNTCSLCGADPHGPVHLSVTSLSKPFSVCPSFHQWRFIPALFSLSFLLLFFFSFYVRFFLPLILLFLFGGTEPSSGRSSPLSSRPATPTLSLTPKHFHVPGRSWSVISLFFFSREFFLLCLSPSIRSF